MIGIVLGCLGGGDNPTNWGGFGAASKRGKRVFIGVSGGFDLVYMGVSVCATRVRGALRVTRGASWVGIIGMVGILCGLRCAYRMCQRITLHLQ